MKKNVIIFFTDQQRFDTLGVHNNPMGLTPNLDRVAQENTHCFNAFTPQPVCLPARSVLQTGKFASQINCNTNEDTLPTDEKTLAHYFNEAGYETGYIGKWHLNATDNKVFTRPQGGYKHWLAANILEFVSDDYNAILYNETGEEVKLPGYRVDAIADASIRYIEKNKDKPFFLMTSLLEPHFQNHRDDYPAPTGYEERYLDAFTPPDLKALGGSAARQLPGYYGMVKRIDEAYGRVLDALKSLDLLENTIVVFTSDHGCHFKTRNDEYKRSCHDASIRIPMVFAGGEFTQGGRLQELVSLVDIPPTLLQACGLAVPDYMEGNSIIPLLSRDNKDFPDDVYAEISESQTGRVIRTHRWKYSMRLTDKANVYQEEFLYDLKADKYELNNLIGLQSHSKVTERMRERLIKRMTKIGQPTPVILEAQQREAGQKVVFAKEISS